MIVQLIIVTSDYIFIDDDSILAFLSQETVRPNDVWIESSAITVLTFFCSLIWIASLLAEELDRRTDLNLVSLEKNEEDDGLSQELDKWLAHFELFVNFVEEINNSFGHILTLSMLHGFVVGSTWFFSFFHSLMNPEEEFTVFYIDKFCDLFYPCSNLSIILTKSYQL